MRDESLIFFLAVSIGVGHVSQETFVLLLRRRAFYRVASCYQSREIILPNTIEHIPAVAKAVLEHNSAYLSKLVEARDSNVNEPVRAKGGEGAGFTPLILAAAL